MASNYDQYINEFLTKAKSAQNGIPLTQDQKIVIPNRASLLIALNRFVERNPTSVSEIHHYARRGYTYHYSDSGINNFGVKIYLVFENNGFLLTLKQSAAKYCLKEPRLSLTELMIFIENFKDYMGLDFLTAIAYIRKSDYKQYIDQLLKKMMITKQQLVIEAIKHLKFNVTQLSEFFALSIYPVYMIEEYNDLKEDSPMLKSLIDIFREHNDKDDIKDFKSFVKNNVRNNEVQQFLLNALCKSSETPSTSE